MRCYICDAIIDSEELMVESRGGVLGYRPCSKCLSVVTETRLDYDIPEEDEDL